MKEKRKRGSLYAFDWPRSVRVTPLMVQWTATSSLLLSNSQRNAGETCFEFVGVTVLEFDNVQRCMAKPKGHVSFLGIFGEKTHGSP